MSKRATGLTATNVIICDDVRREPNGKEILIGVYSGDILVPEVPTGLLLFVWINILANEPIDAKGKIRVQLPGSAKNAIEIDASFGAKNKGDVASVTIPNLPIQIDKEGILKVSWRIDDGRWKELISKKIRVKQPMSAPTASPPPSGQSPFAAQGSAF